MAKYEQQMLRYFLVRSQLRSFLSRDTLQTKKRGNIIILPLESLHVADKN